MLTLILTARKKNCYSKASKATSSLSKTTVMRQEYLPKEEGMAGGNPGICYFYTSL